MLSIPEALRTIIFFIARSISSSLIGGRLSTSSVGFHISEMAEDWYWNEMFWCMGKGTLITKSKTCKCTAGTPAFRKSCKFSHKIVLSKSADNAPNERTEEPNPSSLNVNPLTLVKYNLLQKPPNQLVSVYKPRGCSSCKDTTDFEKIL